MDSVQAGKLIGIQRLAGEYPFRAKALERFDLRARPAVGTMVVTVASKGDSGSQTAGHSCRPSQSGKGGRPNDRTCVVLDEHSVWQKAARDPKRGGAALKAVLQDAAINVGGARVPDYLRDALAAMGIGHTRGCGRCPPNQQVAVLVAACGGLCLAAFLYIYITFFCCFVLLVFFLFFWLAFIHGFFCCFVFFFLFF